MRRLLGRHAEQAEDHQSRDLKGKIGNEVGFALVGKSIDCFVHDIANLGLQRLEASRAERVLDNRPQPGVIGRHPRRQTGPPFEPAGLEDAQRLFRQGPERRLRVFR